MKSPPDLTFEKGLWLASLNRVGGIDEAGRGALAGPVAAAVVLLPPDPSLSRTLSGVRDSKQMTARARAFWAPAIKETSTAWAIGLASAAEIDELGIVPCTRLAVMRAIAQLPSAPDFLLTDYLILPACDIPQNAIVKGDQRSLSIAAASVLAKTFRDALMLEWDAQYPAYGFAQHKGYGTLRHRSTVHRLGPCPIHRLSFSLRT